MAAASATMANPSPTLPTERIEHPGTQGWRDAGAMIGHLQRGGQGVNRHIDGFKARAKVDSERTQALRDGGGYRRDHLRAPARRVEGGEVEVGDGEARIIGSKSRLLQVLTGKVA